MNLMMFVVPKSLVSYIDIDSTVRQAIEKMKYHRYVAIPVLDGEGKYIGTLNNDDILGHFIEQGGFDTRSAEETTVRELISKRSAPPLYHTASMSELIEGVKEHNFVSVVDDRGCFIGIILRRDVLNYLLKFYNENNENDGGKQ